MLSWVQCSKPGATLLVSAHVLRTLMQHHNI
jgi:hypothetical protein